MSKQTSSPTPPEPQGDAASEASESPLATWIVVVLAVLMCAQIGWLIHKYTRPTQPQPPVGGAPVSAPPTQAPLAPPSGTASGQPLPPSTGGARATIVGHGFIVDTNTKLTLKHEAIPQMKLNATTTSFAADKDVLKAFEAGKEVDFFIETVNGVPTVVKVFLMPGANRQPPPDPNAPGAPVNTPPTGNPQGPPPTGDARELAPGIPPSGAPVGGPGTSPSGAPTGLQGPITAPPTGPRGFPASGAPAPQTTP